MNWNRRQLRALIIDDEPLAREGLAALLAEDPDVGSVQEASNADQALNKIRESDPHLVFLDVEMPEGSGFSVLKSIASSRAPAIVFVTAYERYALAAFDNDAADYLLKPVTRERFRMAVERAKRRVCSSFAPDAGPAFEGLAPSRSRYLERIAVKSGEATKLVKTSDVRWIEADENYVKIHAARDTYLLHVTMNTIVSGLDPRLFLRVHRSAAVNINSIKQIHPASNGEYVLTLDDGNRIRSGRTYRNAVRSLVWNPF
jgi:two-component system LytT family response regulator